MNKLRKLIVAEAERVIELLESDCDFNRYTSPKEKAEVKVKMGELRRDTIRLEKMLYE